MLSSLDRAALEFGLEPLETRRMLTTASVSSTHVLNIVGTPGNDTIIVNKLSNGKVSVSGVSTQFTPGSGTGQFKTINVNAGNGNNFVQINNNVVYTASTIQAGSGADTLTGGAGNDSLGGGGGNDTLDGEGGADTLFGDSGTDLANYSYRTDNLTITLDGVNNDGAAGEHDNVECEEVITGSGNDSIVGSSGDDFLSGGAGADTLLGEDGNDVLTGSAGLDSMLGGAGDDFIQAQNQDADTLNGGGAPGLDFASLDSIDVPAVLQNLAKPLALGAIIGPNVVPTPTTSPSDLDTTYGENGTGTETGPELGISITAAAVDSQGRIVFVGYGFRTKSGGGYGDDMIVTRFTADGKPDTTFGNAGEEDIDFTPGSGYGYGTDDLAYGVAIASDDSIVVVGSTFNANIANGDIQFGIAKLDNTGNLDNNFGTGGLATLDLTTDSSDSFNAFARAVAIQSDGNIVVAGGRDRINTDVTNNPADEFDADNNPSGVWSYGYIPNITDEQAGPTTNFDTPTQVDGLDYWTSSQLPSGESIAPDVGHNGTNETIDGISEGTLFLDPGFNGQLAQVTFTAPKSGFYDVSGEFDPAVSEGTPTTDVHVLINGQSQFDGTLDSDNTSAPFEVDGTFLNAGDTVSFAVGFGSNQTFENDTTALSATVERTSAPDDQSMAVARFTPQGQPDTNFNFGQGWNNILVGGDTTVSSVALQTLPSDLGAQRIVVGGTSGGNIVVSRFNSDGTVDLDFGDTNEGYSSDSIDDGDSDGQINDIAVDANNNIYAVGAEGDLSSSLRPATSTSDPDPDVSSLLVSYDSNGFINDSVFGDSGTAYNGVTVDGKGRILAVGTDGEDYLVGRYNSDLSFDTSFAPGPVTTDLTPDGFDGSFDDTALTVSVLDNNNIVVGGFSSNSNDGELVDSGARYLGDPNNPFGVVGVVTDLNNPPPELQNILDNLTPGASQVVDTQPDANGNVNIDTNNPKGDVITITTVTAKDGEKNDDVNINGIHSYYDVTTTKSITIKTDGGADVITADSTVKTTLIVYAGEGDDSITGGGGKNFLFGQGGNDTINGGAVGDALVGGAGQDHVNGNGGNDIVIGSANNDTLNGGAGQDIVIAGSTSYDADVNALRSLLAEWNSGDSRATKISNITNGTGSNSPFKLNPTGGLNATVVDDSVKDSLTGGADSDWFFYKKTGSKADVISDLVSGEQVNLL
jgi:uncharacterized delta-60 repeat protein